MSRRVWYSVVLVWGAFGDPDECLDACADDAGIVRVWDSIAGHWTTCHRLTDDQQAAIRRDSTAYTTTTTN